MSQQTIDAAVKLLVAARRTGDWLEALPPEAKPADLAEAHAIQDATAAALGDTIAGWKVALPQGQVTRGIILGSCLLESPATKQASQVPLLGIEGEIGFRFDRALPSRDQEYGREEVMAAVTALVGIEVVASRFRNYPDVPVLDRTADCMSNGVYVVGTVRPDWRDHALADLEVTLAINGETVVRKRGEHPTGDPLLPAVALVNELRKSTGVKAGQVITTGTCTGMPFAKPGDHVTVTFTDFGTAEIDLPA
ncbi:MAG TPA: fumarylacetoacetate hydrolase family protein [Aliidongia sp.]|uniref:2-keto-4-pentenoate hydratase n=1 Tax=Aliidongia sp. TaxID=1914230 RepID=UPI002DDD5865|nr:fumarylacetoacetate hydrolase family protein [Aliidongia sp.]HEV2677349.1 fumarylacetoacetate hydrolase family protein [Aliidongia sp.]